MKPHKHAELIKAWADGAEIQIKNLFGDWVGTEPLWGEHHEYRIKPKEKVVRWLWVNRSKYDNTWYVSSRFMTEAEANECAKETGITQYKKLEWSREEFDE